MLKKCPYAGNIRQRKDLQKINPKQENIIGSYISIITLNVNGLNAPTKDTDWLGGWQHVHVCTSTYHIILVDPTVWLLIVKTDKHLFTILIQFSSLAQSCLTLGNPMDCSMPHFPIHLQLPELAQTHVHRVSDAIQPSHPQSSPSPAFNLAQHQGLFK